MTARLISTAAHHALMRYRDAAARHGFYFRMQDSLRPKRWPANSNPDTFQTLSAIAWREMERWRNRFMELTR